MKKPFSVEAALRHRFRQPEWAILFEVRNQTGFGRVTRTADAVAMSLFPSRGLELVGIEIKKSRSDWIRELRQPEKSTEIQRYCDRWYIAVGDDAIVQPGELPKTWGLMIPRGSKLIVKVEAPALTPEPVDKRFLAALLRNAHVNSASGAEIEHAVQIERERLRAEHDADRGAERSRYARQFEDLNTAVIEFEKASGVLIRHKWDAPQIGAAVAFVRNGGIATLRKELERLGSNATNVAAQIKRVLDEDDKKSASQAPGSEG